MAREDFNELLAFLAVANERSFTKAAAKLGLSQSTLSHTIRRLETRLGLRLLTRTTRSVVPTEAGDRLARSLGPRIEEIEAEISALTALRDKPSGTIRITVSDHAYQAVLWPKLAPRMREYPDIKVEFSIDNGLSNIVEERFDAGVRLGENVAKDMVAVRIGPDWRLVVVGSPDYLAQRPPLVTPQGLVAHNCINLRLLSQGGLYVWEFERDGHTLRVRVDGQLTFTSTSPMVDAVLEGYGLAFLPEDLVADHIAEGRLEIVLEDWSPYFDGYYLYYPSRRQMSPALSVLIDILRHRGPTAPAK